MKLNQINYAGVSDNSADVTLKMVDAHVLIRSMEHYNNSEHENRQFPEHMEKARVLLNELRTLFTQIA